MNVEINRQKLCLEDIEFGEGTVEQTRHNQTVVLTQINASIIPSGIEGKTLAEIVQTATSAEAAALLSEYEAEAAKRTAISYDSEAEDTLVNIVTSNGDGTYTSTPQAGIYSALHYKNKAAASALAASTSESNAGDSAIAASASESASAASELASQLTAWESEAFKLTANSYAIEPVDTFVKIYTSNGDGTFTATPTTDYSSLHHSLQANPTLVQNITIGNKIGNPTHIDNLEEIYNHMYSSGILSGCDLTDNLDGTVDISAGSATLRAPGDSGHGLLYSAEIPAVAGLTLTDNQVNYVYVSYNDGITPSWGVSILPGTINLIDIIPAYVIVREGTSLTYLDGRSQNVDHIAKNQIKEFYTNPFQRKNGGSVVGDAGTLHLTCTAGAFFFQLNEVPVPALDTTGTDTFEYYKHVSGVWTETDAQVLDPAYYDDGTDLVAVGNNNYAVHWLYAIVGNTSHYAVVYGNDEYANISNAKASTAPTSLPKSIEGLGVLIGRAITQQGSTEIVDIVSAFDVVFKATSVTDHENLTGLLGGGVGDHVHLTTAQVAKVDATTLAGKGITDAFTKTELTKAVGRLNNPLLDLPLNNSLSMKQGVGSTTFSRATTATYIDRYGVLQYAAIDEPRFEKDGLLIEGASTNLATNSSDVSLWTYYSITLSTDTTTKLDGTLATKITGDGTSGEHITEIQAAISEAKARTVSVFLKKADVSIVDFHIYYLGGSGVLTYNTAVNFDTGTLSDTTFFGIKECANGWFRVWCTIANTDQTEILGRVYAGAAGINTSTDSVYVADMQIEELPFASSYIPTTTSAVTRAGDVCVVAYENNANISDDFSLSYTVKCIHNDLRWGTIIDIGNAKLKEQFWEAATGSNLSYYNNSTYTNTNINRNSSTVFTKVLSNTSYSSYINGTLDRTDTVTLVLPSDFTIQLGADTGGVVAVLYGHIKNFKVYDKSLSSTEVALLGGN